MLGIPEFRTNFVGAYVDGPSDNFAELALAAGALMRRTFGWAMLQDLIKQGLPTCPGCRDDIMVYLMHKGPKMAFTIMERVRKGLWLKDY